MSQATDATARQQLNLINSPVFKAISCIPCVGFVSTVVFAAKVFRGNFTEGGVKKDILRRIEGLKIGKEYEKIDTVRNLLDVALIVGAVALGLLSFYPTGVVLGSACLLLAMFHAYQIRRLDQGINTLQPARA